MPIYSKVKDLSYDFKVNSSTPNILFKSDSYMSDLYVFLQEFVKFSIIDDKIIWNAPCGLDDLLEKNYFSQKYLLMKWLRVIWQI